MPSTKEILAKRDVMREKVKANMLLQVPYGKLLPTGKKGDGLPAEEEPKEQHKETKSQ